MRGFHRHVSRAGEADDGMPRSVGRAALYRCITNRRGGAGSKEKSAASYPSCRDQSAGYHGRAALRNVAVAAPGIDRRPETESVSCALDLDRTGGRRLVPPERGNAGAQSREQSAHRQRPRSGEATSLRRGDWGGENGRGVDTVIVNGEVVVECGRLTKVDELEVLRLAEHARPRLDPSIQRELAAAKTMEPARAG